MAAWKNTLEYSLIIERSYPFLNKPKYVTRTNWGDVETDGDKLRLFILKDYSWNGCPPKIKIGNYIFGMWDGFIHPTTKKPKTYYSSLQYDFLCQFLHRHNLNKKECDLVFYYSMLEYSFELPTFYYAAAKIFGREEN